MHKALSMLGLCRKAGRLEIGEEPVGAVCRARKAKLIVLAADAADNTVRRAEKFSRFGPVGMCRTPFTKEELGALLGRGVCAVAAITDAGMAKAFQAALDSAGNIAGDTGIV